MNFFGNDFSVASPSDYSDFAQNTDSWDWSIPDSEELYPTGDSFSLFNAPSFEPDGGQLIDSRSNSSFWNFDQSKITNGLFDVLGSVGSAAAKTAIQGTADQINTGANQQGQLGAFFRNFQSTQTGAQLNAASYATRIQNWFANPVVWLMGVGLLGLVIYTKLKR